MDKYAEKAKKIIAGNIYMVIATSSQESKPWISPVFFVYDSDYNLYLVSNKDALHSNLVRNNSQVAIVIFNSEANEGSGTGVYFEAKAQELGDEKELNKAIGLWNKRVNGEDFKIKDIGKVSGEGIWRVYKATPTKISQLTEGTFIKGQYVDTRIEVSLKN